jgi:hypothetical protein
MLERIEAGDRDATSAMRPRIEGAIAVPDVAQGGLRSSTRVRTVIALTNHRGATQTL